MTNLETPIGVETPSSPSPLKNPYAETIVNGYDPEFIEAAQALFDTLPPERQAEVRRLGKVNREYVMSSRHQSVEAGIDKICNNAAAGVFGISGKRRAYWILGESDSGKTRTIENIIPKRPEFQPRRTPDGIVRPFVSWEPPRPLTMKGFARSGLAACGYPVENQKMTEQELFDLFKTVIRKNRILFMHIDEMQHVLKGNKTAEVQNVSDIIKSLLQIPGWPLHLILSGVPTLARFLVPEDGDRQLRNRSFVTHLRRIGKNDTEMMLGLQSKIMAKAGVASEETDTPDFMHRLIHASSGAFGTMIQMMQEAAERALHDHKRKGADGDARVTMQHYADLYALHNASLKSQNVFLRDNWEEIQPQHALAVSLGTRLTDDQKGSSRKKVEGR